MNLEKLHYTELIIKPLVGKAIMRFIDIVLRRSVDENNETIFNITILQQRLQQAATLYQTGCQIIGVCYMHNYK